MKQPAFPPLEKDPNPNPLEKEVTVFLLSVPFQHSAGSGFSSGSTLVIVLLVVSSAPTSSFCNWRQ